MNSHGQQSIYFSPIVVGVQSASYTLYQLTNSLLIKILDSIQRVKEVSYIFFKISDCPFRTHFQTLSVWWRYIITTTPLMDFLLSISICGFLLIESLKFPIPENIYSIYDDLRDKESFKNKSRKRQGEMKSLHSFIQLPCCYNWYWLLFSLLTINFTP